MRTASQQLRTVDADAPIVRLHRLMLSLFGSGEEFRRWVALGPSGREFAAELPDGPGSMAAALLGGIEVLRRRGHLDAEFFARLASEFPRRAGEIEMTGREWRMSVR